MRTSNSTRILLVIALIVIAGVSYYSSRDGEYREARIYGPENRQLLLERLHIAERWLQEQDKQVEVLKTLQFLDTMPASGNLLIISTALGELARIEAAQLQQWVLRGGHLIATAPNSRRTPSSAFDLNSFGVRNCYDCLREAHDAAKSSAKDVEATAFNSVNRIEIIGLDERPLRLWSQVALDIENPSSKLKQWRSDQGVPMLVSYAFGAGEITLLPDNQWLNNEQMIEADHARLLSALIPADAETIYLQHYSIPGGLLTWLWQQAPALWLAMLALAGLWVWSRLPRLGAVLADPEPQANQMRERLRATARFDWRHNQGKNLMHAMRETLSQRAQRRYPDWHQLSQSQQIERLSRLCPDLQAELIQRFMAQSQIGPSDRLIEYLSVQRSLMHAL